MLKAEALKNCVKDIDFVTGIRRSSPVETCLNNMIVASDLLRLLSRYFFHDPFFSDSS